MSKDFNFEDVGPKDVGTKKSTVFKLKQKTIDLRILNRGFIKAFGERPMVEIEFTREGEIENIIFIYARSQITVSGDKAAWHSNLESLGAEMGTVLKIKVEEG